MWILIQTFKAGNINIAIEHSNNRERERFDSSSFTHTVIKFLIEKGVAQN